MSKIILFPSGIGRDKELKRSNEILFFLQELHFKIDFN